MYRREWRRGGLEHHDEPIEIVDPRQRLVVALMQKKVAEVLQTERFNNHFQIGMLSSFESFLQSVETARRRNEDEPAFDGEEQRRRLSDRERNGIDTEAIGEVVRSYREVFGNTLPHPKLDTTAAALSGAFETGEKTLVFVRRVATVDELAAKLDESFDAWIRARMEARLPELHEEVAAFQKNRLSSTSSAYATLFEDDYVASLLDVEAGGVIESLAAGDGRFAGTLRRAAAAPGVRILPGAKPATRGLSAAVRVRGVPGGWPRASPQVRRGDWQAGGDCAGGAVPG